MKIVVLKPVMWNTNQYLKPSGYPSKSGFAKDNGYGHEEWNNNPKRVWRNHKIFHTESTDRLLHYSATGELAIVAIASHNGSQYAVSIATNVFHNDKDERRIISEELQIFEDWRDVWQLDDVKQRFGHDENVFLQHWRENYEWIRWKCPVEQYYHFGTPVLLNPEYISGHTRLATMHGRFQAIYPEQALEIVKSDLANSHPISKWLSSPDFDESIISEGQKNRYTPRKSKTSKNANGANAPAIRRYEYWVEGNIMDPGIWTVKGAKIKS